MPGASFTVDMAIQHVSRGSNRSPCISVTKSYAVAETYARGGLFAAGAKVPGYVYVIDIPNPTPLGMEVIDPVFVVAARHNNPLASPSYHHDGSQQFLLGIVSPDTHGKYLRAPISNPPGASGAIRRSANLTWELQTMVLALRDAEALVLGNIQKAWVIDRYDIYR